MHYPFGSLLPGRSGSSAAYRYGFNGKEKDDEIKGEGNSLDFGARMYDSRIGRWFAVDKMRMKAPDWSPYRYGFDNPISYQDPNGKFEIPIHARITSEALKKSNAMISTNAELNILLGNTIMSDILGGFSDYHFDGRKNFTEIKDTWKNLKKDISNIDFGSMNKNLGGFDANALGVNLHTVQDFYSHSNYVELYVEYYKSGHEGKMPTVVPIYDEGVLIKGFKDLMNRTTYDKEGKYQGLHTGEFDLKDNEFWDINPLSDKHTGPNSHKQTNKDHADTPEGKLAVDVATKHSEIIINEVITD